MFVKVSRMVVPRAVTAPTAAVRRVRDWDGPRRVCVVSGAAKLGSLRAAIAAGIVTDAVLDETLARLLSEEN